MINPALEVLRPFVTERINELVRARLFDALKFYDGHTLRAGFTKGEVKLTLLLVRIANPKEFLNEDEIALIEARQIQKGAREQQKSARDEQKSASGKKRPKRGL